MTDIMEMIEGRVFHVTRRAHWGLIQAAGEIQPNTDGAFPTTFGHSTNSFFRKRGCVSVFDYRAPSDETSLARRRGCHPFSAARDDEGIAILLLDSSVEAALLPWTLWETANAPSEMVVPRVEAGHPGPIPISKIDDVIFLRVEEDPNSPVARLRRGRIRS